MRRERIPEPSPVFRLCVSPRDNTQNCPLCSNAEHEIDYALLAKAIGATIENRKHGVTFESFPSVIEALRESETLRASWENYRSKSSFASELTWDEALTAVWLLCEKAGEAHVVQ